jgi:hypothetical protein
MSRWFFTMALGGWADQRLMLQQLKRPLPVE